MRYACNGSAESTRAEHRDGPVESRACTLPLWRMLDAPGALKAPQISFPTRGIDTSFAGS